MPYDGPMTNETTAPAASFTLAARRLPALRDAVARIARQADRLGVEAPRLVEGEATTTTRRTPFGDVEETTVAVEVFGTTPRLPGGWAFLGALEHTPTGDLVHGDDPRVAAFRGQGPHCDHCGLDRARLSTFVLAAEDGRVVRVGRSCLVDFLGAVRFEVGGLWTLAHDLEAIGRDDEDGAWGSKIDLGADRLSLLTLAAAAIRTHGWVPKSFQGAQAIPTAALVDRMAFGPYGPRSHDRYGMAADPVWEAVEAITVADEDRDLAGRVVAWVAALPVGGSEYLENLRTVLAAETVESRRVGLAASAVSAYLREVEKVALRKARDEAQKDSRHLGAVGDRLELDVTVTFVRAFPGDYGTSYLVTMVTPDGDVVKTFSSGAFGQGAEAGQVARIKGTVKAHETYRDRAETMLARVKDVTPAPAAS